MELIGTKRKSDRERAARGLDFVGFHWISLESTGIIPVEIIPLASIRRCFNPELARSNSRRFYEALKTQKLIKLEKEKL